MRQRAECPTCREWLLFETSHGRLVELCPHCDLKWPKSRVPQQPPAVAAREHAVAQRPCVDCGAACRRLRCLDCSQAHTRKQQRIYDQRKKRSA